MRTFLTQLQAATRYGAALALLGGCSGSVVNSGGGGGAGGDSASGGGGSGGDATTSGDPGTLEPPPELECHGPVYEEPRDGGYSGQCCDKVTCGPLVDGVCPAPDDVVTYELWDYPSGSGDCACATFRGPFANELPEEQQGGPCCYVIGEIGCEGRPLLIDGQLRLAEVLKAPSGWPQRTNESALDASALSQEERAALGAAWGERARFEHASIASFARFTLQLLAAGAPAELIEKSQRALGDELRHARIALGFASACSGSPLAFGALDISGAAGGETLEDAVLATVVEGCVGETLAAIEAASCAAEANTAELRSALGEVARDEAEHASLAWSFVAWAIAGSGGAELRARVASSFERACAEALVAPTCSDLPAAVATGRGFLPSSAIRELRARAIRDVVRPAARELLASSRRRATSNELPAILRG